MGISTVSSSILATILLGSATAFAGPPCDEVLLFLEPPPPLEHPCDVPPPPPGCGRMHPRMQHERYGLAPEPRLPPELRRQVAKLLQAEQSRLEPLLQKLQENRQALLQVVALRPLDEKALAALGDEQGKLEAELLVARVRTHNRVKLLLDQAKPVEKPVER